MKRQALSTPRRLDSVEPEPVTVSGPVLAGLIGWPVDHSVSPAMHNAAFEALGLDGRYLLVPTEPPAVAATLADLQRNGYRGINVTVPHKQAVMPYLDELTDAARVIGAVNTILIEGDRMLGYNTDAGGFLSALREVGCEPPELQVLVLGAGGAARAVVYTLVGIGCHVSIHNRTVVRAEALVSSLQSVGGARGAGNLAVVTTPLVDLDLDRFDLLVNTTPVGMWPETEASPWPAGLPLPARWTVVDLVYNPRIRAARRRSSCWRNVDRGTGHARPPGSPGLQAMDRPRPTFGYYVCGCKGCTRSAGKGWSLQR